MVMEFEIYRENSDWHCFPAFIGMDYEFDLRIGKTGKGFYNSVCEAPVAQLDRASVYGTEGYTFEPCRVY